MKDLKLLCFLTIFCGSASECWAQSGSPISSVDKIYPDRSGKVIAFKAYRPGGSDTVYFVDVNTAELTDKVADGSFGLAFKMMKAGVLDKKELMGTELRAFPTFSIHKDRANFEEYFVRLRDSTLARAWLPRVSYHSYEPRAFIKEDDPKKVLLGVRLNKVAMLYDMLDTLAEAKGRLLYSVDLNGADYRELETGHLQNVQISPDGNHLFSMPDGTMIDLVKGGKVWKYDYRKTGATRVVFSEDGNRIAIAHEDHTVSIHEVRNGKRLYRIPALPDLKKNLKMKHFMPLADMQTCFVSYTDGDSAEHKILLLKAKGKALEVRP